MRTLPPRKFEELEALTSAVLFERGYALAAQKLDGPFGSRSTEFRRGKQTVTLSWDGRDNAVSLVFTPDADAAHKELSILASINLDRKFDADLERFGRQLTEHLKNAI
jgi:hypothetical protein